MKSKYIYYLEKKEKIAIAKTMAFMSYNPSIGRVLEKGGVKVFQNMVVKKINILQYIKTKKQFEIFHKKWLNEIIKNINTNGVNLNKKCSVGQAQKAINVFLKLFVDWSNLPNKKVARILLPFLHVPLDRILMNNMQAKFPEDYEKKIKIFRKNNSNSLSLIGEKEYYAWQNIFRELNPKKPLLFDIVWAVERERQKF
jgi:hypothetical protein